MKGILQRMPLHRSLVFWCGLMIVGPVVVSWVDSMRWVNVMVLSFGSAPAGEVAASAGSIDISTGKIGPGPVRGVSFQRVPLWSWTGTGEDPDIWGDGVKWGKLPAFGFSYARVPHWLLVACLLPPWLGASVWRARRIGRGN